MHSQGAVSLLTLRCWLLQEHVKQWLEADGAVDQTATGLQAANSSPQATGMNMGPAPAGRFSFGMPAMLATGVDAMGIPSSAVASVRSLPVGHIGVDMDSAAGPSTTAGIRQRSRSLSPGKRPSPSQRLASPVVLPNGKPQRQQQQWDQQGELASMERRRSGAEASTSTAVAGEAVASIAESADAVASAVRSKLEALIAGTTAGAPYVQQLQERSNPQLRAYSGLLLHAKQFIKQRRRDIQQRQASVLAAQSEWKAAVSATEQQASVDGDDGEAVQQLRQLKGVLQEQIHSLNDETRQLKALKAQVGVW